MILALTAHTKLQDRDAEGAKTARDHPLTTWYTLRRQPFKSRIFRDSEYSASFNRAFLMIRTGMIRQWLRILWKGTFTPIQAGTPIETLGTGVRLEHVRPKKLSILSFRSLTKKL